MEGRRRTSTVIKWERAWAKIVFIFRRLTCTRPLIYHGTQVISTHFFGYLRTYLIQSTQDKTVHVACNVLLDCPFPALHIPDDAGISKREWLLIESWRRNRRNNNYRTYRPKRVAHKESLLDVHVQKWSGKVPCVSLPTLTKSTVLIHFDLFLSFPTIPISLLCV